MNDVLIRSARTFAQTFLAVLAAASTNYLNVSTVKAAAVAGGAAVLAFLSGWVAPPVIAKIRKPA